MKKLWQKDPPNGETSWELNPVIESFETKGDILLDQKLVKFDVQGSIAHAKMLEKIGIISKEELNQARIGLLEILELDRQKKFVLKLGDEDVHTKIENYLTEKYGKVGKKIHTGRSRNDQVLTSIRLLCKYQLQKIHKELLNLIKEFHLYEKKYGDILMPGYTHMQKAMPSSIKIWAQSFAESLADDLVVLEGAERINNQSPLGSAAGYGAPLKLDREYTSKLLGFEKVQNNPLYCQNSKGKIEAVVVASLVNILQTINKFASDVMISTTSEFGFFEVSNELTTGSSIMPQKKNIDVAELLRSKVHVVLGNYIQIVSLSSNLISGYNRDLQDIKKPLIESLEMTLESIQVTKVLLKGLIPDEGKLSSAMTDDLYAAEKAFKLVEKGLSFRDAYKKVSSEIFKKNEK